MPRRMERLMVEWLTIQDFLLAEGINARPKEEVGSLIVQVIGRCLFMFF